MVAMGRTTMVSIVLLMMVSSSPPWRQKTIIPDKTCSRERSALARRIIHQVWMPVVTGAGPGLRLGQQCPLHPARDVHGKAELTKLHYRVNLWTCAACGKSFNREVELEQHIAARHSDLTYTGDFSVCLADFCDILRCDSMRQSRRQPWPTRPTPHPSTAQLVKAPSRELVALLENSEHLPQDEAFQQRIRRHGCPGGRCQETPGCPGGRCHEVPQRPACPPSGCGQQNNEYSFNSNNSADDNDEKSDNEKKSEDCVRRDRCDRRRMGELRNRCEALIDMCVSGLALQMVDEDFVRLKGGLHKQLCWFLTCERYWNFPETKKPPYPIGILLVILAAAVIFLSFAYYVVWVCF